jgi:hypothetical protein
VASARFSPRTCSGLNVADGSPATVPGRSFRGRSCVSSRAAIARRTGGLRKSKSRIMSRPSLVSHRFSGLRSRCTTPFSVAGGQAAGELNAQLGGFAWGKRALLEAGPQGFAFEEFP